MNKILQFSSRPKPVPKRTFEAEGYIAEVYFNHRIDPPVHHYVVMPKDSVEIVGWGQEHSAKAAERMALTCIEMLIDRHSYAG